MGEKAFKEVQTLVKEVFTYVKESENKRIDKRAIAKLRKALRFWKHAKAEGFMDPSYSRCCFRRALRFRHDEGFNCAWPVYFIREAKTKRPLKLDVMLGATVTYEEAFFLLQMIVDLLEYFELTLSELSLRIGHHKTADILVLPPHYKLHRLVEDETLQAVTLGIPEAMFQALFRKTDIPYPFRVLKLFNYSPDFDFLCTSFPALEYYNRKLLDFHDTAFERLPALRNIKCGRLSTAAWASLWEHAGTRLQDLWLRVGVDDITSIEGLSHLLSSPRYAIQKLELWVVERDTDVDDCGETKLDHAMPPLFRAFRNNQSLTHVSLNNIRICDWWRSFEMHPTLHALHVRLHPPFNEDDLETLLDLIQDPPKSLQDLRLVRCDGSLFSEELMTEVSSQFLSLSIRYQSDSSQVLCRKLIARNKEWYRNWIRIVLLLVFARALPSSQHFFITSLKPLLPRICSFILKNS